MHVIDDGEIRIPSPKKFLMNLLKERVERGNTVPAHQGPWEKVRCGDITYDIDIDDFPVVDLVIKAKPCKATVIDIVQLLYQFLCALGFSRAADNMYDDGGVGVMSGLEDSSVMCHQTLRFMTDEA